MGTLAQHCGAGVWSPAVEGLGAGLFSACLFQAQDLCLRFARLVILKTMCIEYGLLLNSCLLKKQNKTKRQKLGKHQKTIKSNLKASLLFLGILNRRTPVILSFRK